MSPDPFDLLRDELAGAAARAARPKATTRPPAWRRARGRRPLIALVGALALCGTATAAVLTLTGGEPSAPLKGRVPGVSAGTPGVSRYAIAMSPDLRAGVAGWCSTITFRGRRDAADGGMRACGPAHPARVAQIAGGGVTIGPSKILNYRVVDRRVALVRLPDGRRLVPRADPSLPFGWRGVVAFVPYQPGRRISAAAFDLQLLDAQGRPLAGGGKKAQVDAIPSLPTVAVDPRHPPRRPCALTVGGHTPHLSARGQKVVSGPLVAAVDVNGRAFRACAEAIYDFDGTRLRTATLIDAAGPATRPAALPGAKALAGHRGIVVAAGAITARRAGNAWLAVAGDDPAARLRLLQRLRVHPPIR